MQVITEPTGEWITRQFAKDQLVAVRHSMQDIKYVLFTLFMCNTEILGVLSKTCELDNCLLGQLILQHKYWRTGNLYSAQPLLCALTMLLHLLCMLKACEDPPANTPKIRLAGKISKNWLSKLLVLTKLVVPNRCA